MKERDRAARGLGKGESELWKVIPFANQYKASTLGRVMRIKTGYTFHPTGSVPQVNLFLGPKKKKCFALHKLIARTFLENPDNSNCIIHIDGNKQNNSVNNLKWCTYSETMQYAYDSGLKKPTRGPAIHTPLGIFTHQREAAKAVGISHTALRARLKSNHFPDWYNISESIASKALIQSA